MLKHIQRVFTYIHSYIHTYLTRPFKIRLVVSWRVHAIGAGIPTHNEVDNMVEHFPHGRVSDGQHRLTSETGRQVSSGKPSQSKNIKVLEKHYMHLNLCVHLYMYVCMYVYMHV